MQFDNGGGRRGNVQEQRKAPPVPRPSVNTSHLSHLSSYIRSQPPSSQPCLHYHYVVGYSPCLEYLWFTYPPCIGGAWRRAGEWCYFNDLQLSGGSAVCLGRVRQRRRRPSSIPTTGLWNVARFIQATEWLCLFYSPPLGGNRGN